MGVSTQAPASVAVPGTEPLPPGPAQDAILARANEQLKTRGFLTAQYESLIDWEIGRAHV